MSWIKRAAALTLTLAVALPLAACGGKDGNEAVAAAQERMGQLTSVDAVIQMDGEYAMGEETIPTANRMEATLFTEPEPRLKAAVTTEAEGLGSQEMTIYAESDGTSYTQYMTDGSVWLKSTASADDMDKYNIRDSMGEYLSKGEDYRAAGTETVDGLSCDKYEGTIRGDALVEVLESSGALKVADSMSEDQQTKIKEGLKTLKGLTITVWVDKESGCPAKYTMDLTGVLAQAQESIDESLGHPDSFWDSVVVLKKMMVTMTCSNFNAATDFTIPDEAKDAQDISELTTGD